MSFSANVGSVDRVLRIVLGLGLLAFAIFSPAVAASSALGIAMIAAGVIFAATAVISFCPLYSIFNLRTGGK